MTTPLMPTPLNATSTWTALVTPFTPDAKEVDYETLERLLKRQETAGNGILILGSTGEATALSDAEKREIVRMTTALHLEVPIMVGTPNINRLQTLEWIEFCGQQAGIAALLAAPPVYAKPATQGQIGWFHEVLEASAVPVMLYNIPSRTGVSLPPAVLGALQGHRNFWAVKESSGTVGACAEFRAAAENVAIYCGDDAMMPAVAPFGARGLISVASNVWPEECRAYAEDCLAGRYRGTEWWFISNALFSTTSPVPVKTLMEDLELAPSGAVRSPLSREDLRDKSGLQTAHRSVAAWFARRQALAGPGGV